MSAHRPEFSANLGFLWKDLPLPQAIAAAARAGFDAVECHFPFAEDPATVKAALAKAGLEMLSLNTRPGGAGEFGLAALPGREEAARAAIGEAVAYARTIGARRVHVMAGIASGEAARRVFRENLDFAARFAAEAGLELLIEPINTRDVPGYYLNRVEEAAALIEEIGSPLIRIMFDCYHVQIMQGDLTARLREFLPLIGHIQIAAVPDRGEPDGGEVAYERLVPAILDLGYGGAFGAEYRPRGAVEAGLSWLKACR